MTNTEEQIEISQTWNKFVTKAETEGYREGMSDGRDEVFQKSFDEGFSEGFKIGFNLGMYKGVLSSHSLKSDENLESTRRGLCQICIENKLLETSIEHVQHIQNTISNKVLEDLHNYSVEVGRDTLKLDQSAEDTAEAFMFFDNLCYSCNGSGRSVTPLGSSVTPTSTWPEAITVV